MALGTFIAGNSLTMFNSVGIIPYRNQWLAGLSQVSLGMLTVGTSASWPSPYIAQLTAPDCTHRLKLAQWEASWVISLLTLGLVTGAAIGAITQEYLGRKKNLLTASLPLALGWLLIIVAPTVPWLYASRFIIGISKGMLLSAYGLFMGEIADPMIRGSLVLLVAVSQSVGKLVGTIMGGLLPMETFSYVCILLTVLFFVSFQFVPESPYYHIMKGDIQMAEKSLILWSQGTKKSEDVKREIQKLQDFIQSTSVSVAARINEFKKPQHHKNVLIIICFIVLLAAAGHRAILPYAETILRNGKVELTPSVVVMGLSFSEIVAGTVALVLIDKFGRRALLLTSAIGLTVGYIILGSHFHLLSMGIDPKSISWLPVVSLFIVFFSVPCGLGSASDVFVSELFPPIIKTTMMLVSLTISSLMTFIVVKLFQTYVDLVGEQYVFWTFATSALLSAVLSYFYAPETARKSLMGIQENLNKMNDKSRLTQSAENAEASARVKV